MLDPVVFFFLLGVVAGLVKSDLRLPAALYETLSVFLLLAIGLKGGEELASQPVMALLPQCLAVIAMGLLLPLLVYPLMRLRFGAPDAASFAAHYGSVSVVTFAVGISYLTRRGVPYESQSALFLAILEVPGLVVGVILARRAAQRARAGDAPRMPYGVILHEVLLGKSLILLFGGLAIGWACGPEGLEPVAPLYKGLFKGVLTLFLLELGLVTALQAAVIRRHGWFLLVAGIGLPLLLSLVGLGFAWLLGLSVGGATLLAVMAASASYIAAPAVIRIAVPQANMGLALGSVLGVTFPFNLLLGIPVYHLLAHWVAG